MTMTLAEFGGALAESARVHRFPFPQARLRNTQGRCPIVAVAHLRGVTEFGNEQARDAAAQIGLTPGDAEAIIHESDRGATPTRVRTMLMQATKRVA